MSNRDSKRFAVLINPNELSSVPESPTVSSHPDNTSQAQAPPPQLQDEKNMASSTTAPVISSANNTNGPPPSYRSRSQSQTFSSRPRKSSMRRQAPSGLTFDANKLGVPRKPAGDFPSPGSAPKGTRIFDASAVAENKGVETAQPGWAIDSRTQNKLEDQVYREEHPEDFENVGQKIHRSLSTVKRSASQSVKRARSLRRPRGESSSAGNPSAGGYEPMPPPPPFEDEDAKMVRLSVIKQHD